MHWPRNAERSHEYAHRHSEGAAGLAFDRTGSFELVWIAAILAGIAAAICHLMLDVSPRPLARAERAANL